MVVVKMLIVMVPVMISMVVVKLLRVMVMVMISMVAEMGGVNITITLIMRVMVMKY